MSDAGPRLGLAGGAPSIDGRRLTLNFTVILVRIRGVQQWSLEMTMGHVEFSDQ